MQHNLYTRAVFLNILSL